MIKMNKKVTICSTSCRAETTLTVYYANSVANVFYVMSFLKELCKTHRVTFESRFSISLGFI